MSKFNAALVKTEASLSQVENTAQVHQGNQAASDGRMRVPAELSITHTCATLGPSCWVLSAA